VPKEPQNTKNSEIKSSRHLPGSVTFPIEATRRKKYLTPDRRVSSDEGSNTLLRKS
jgi:hypothetical protein